MLLKLKQKMEYVNVIMIYINVQTDVLHSIYIHAFNKITEYNWKYLYRL